jgi:hypothetical protein
MQTLFGHPVFTVQRQQYAWEDVFMAAQAWGDWSMLDGQVRQGLACLQHLCALGEAPAVQDIEAEAHTFRSHRRLLTADTTEAWLASWGLRPEDWSAYLCRAVLRRRWASSLASLVARYPASAADVAACLKAEAACADYLSRWVWQLANQAAALARELEGHHSATLPDVTPEPTRSVHLAHLDAAFQRFSQQVCTPKALAERLRLQALDWLRCDGLALTLPKAHSAHEAILCVREDGVTLDEVARRAHTIVHHRQWLLEQVNATWRGDLVCAQPGDLLGPWPHGEAFVVFELRQKIPPSLQDPAIHQRARQMVLRQAVVRELVPRIEWHIDIWGTSYEHRARLVA